MTELDVDPAVLEGFARELARVCPGHHGVLVTVAGPGQGQFSHVSLCPAPATAAATQPEAPA